MSLLIHAGIKINGMGSICRVRNEMVHLLLAICIYRHEWVICGIYNFDEHQNNTLVAAYKVCHSSPYNLYCFIARESSWTLTWGKTDKNTT